MGFTHVELESQSDLARMPQVRDANEPASLHAYLRGDRTFSPGKFQGSSRERQPDRHDELHGRARNRGAKRRLIINELRTMCLYIGSERSLCPGPSWGIDF